MITLQRELRFKRIVAYRMAGRFIGFGVTIPLAFMLRDYWALVIAASSGGF